MDALEAIRLYVMAGETDLDHGGQRLECSAGTWTVAGHSERETHTFTH